MKRMTMKFSDRTHEDLLWLSQELQAGNMTATIAQLVHFECLRLRGEQPSVVPIVAPRAILESEKKPIAPKPVQEIKPEKPFSPPEVHVVEHGPVASGSVDLAAHEPSQELRDIASGAKVDQFAAMREAAAAKLEAKKNAPKPITGITSQA